MKNSHSYLFSFFGFVVFAFFSACNPMPHADRLLQEAIQFADREKADSGLHYIDSIFYPEKSLNKDQYMQYLVTNVRLRYKSFCDIRNDSSIFEALQYFKEKGSEPRWAALAAFYSGCVYRERKDTNKAMRLYNEAFTEAKKTKDANLKGLITNNIASLFQEKTLCRQALETYRQAEKFYAPFPNNKVKAISGIGTAYLEIGNNDSALIAYRRGLKLAEQTNDKSGQSLLMQNISIAYQEIGNYSEALRYLHKSFELNDNKTELPRYYLNFGDLYSQMGFADSARFFYDKTKKELSLLSDDYLKISICQSLAAEAKERGDLEEALGLKDQELALYADIMEEHNKTSLLDVQRKYNFELMKNEHQQEISRFLIVIVVLLLFVLAGTAVFFYYFQRKKKQIIEIQDKAATLAKIAAQLEQSAQMQLSIRDNDIRELLFWRFDVVKKSALLAKMDFQNTSVSNIVKKYNSIVYGDANRELQDGMIEVINLIYPNISERMRSCFPEFSEREYQVCLLSYVDMNIKEIAIILELSSNSVQSYRSSIRKKIGLEDPKTDFRLFLMEMMEG